MNKRTTLKSAAALVAVLSLLTGCGANSNQQSSDDSKENTAVNAGSTNNAATSDNAGATTDDAAATNSATQEDPFKDHMDISVSWWGIGAAFQPHDAVLQEIEKKFNITFKAVDVGWDNWNQKSQVWAASGQLPDIITNDLASGYNAAGYSDWINQKLIRPLPDDLSQYPNVEKLAQLPDVQTGIAREGKLYAFPRLTYPNNDMWALDRGIYVRKDWMEKLGIQDPKSFDEFAAMLKAFEEKDPDGNGKKDTVGLVSNNMNFFTVSLMPLLPQLGNNGWLKEDGKWMPFYASKQMDTVVTAARKLYAEGGMDKDFAVEKAGEANQKFYQGKAGAFAGGINGIAPTKAEWEKANPGKNFYDAVKPLHLWPSADGNTYRFTTLTWWSESYFNANVDDKKMDRILRLYDWLISPESKELFSYGIEGKDYTKSGDTITITRPKDEKTGKYQDIKAMYPSIDVISQLAIWANANLYDDSEANRINLGQDTMDFLKNEMDWQMTNAQAIPTEFKIATMSTPAKDKLSSINFNDDLTKIILSKEDPVKMWHDIVKGYESKGLSAAETEVTDIMAKDGK